jgi:acetylornithine deacetylase/succinyl-diaminopimelate desuccinylase-like protein
MEFEPDLAEALLDPDRVREVAEDYPDVGVARVVHSCTHMTVAPTVVSGGVKTNVIPDTVELQLDIRTLPGQSPDEVRGWLREAVGEDLWPDVELSEDAVEPASDSPVDTPLWDSLERVTAALLPGTTTVPYMISGATDARFFRRAGVTSYGFGLYSDRVGFADFVSMFHGDDERVDQESLRLSTELWMALARDLVG